MRFGIFYEHQLPRPWAPDDEHRLLTDALEQVELADRLGIDYLWEVEHHCRSGGSLPFGLSAATASWPSGYRQSSADGEAIVFLHAPALPFPD